MQFVYLLTISQTGVDITGLFMYGLLQRKYPCQNSHLAAKDVLFT